MDVHDSTDEYFQLLQGQKQMLDKAKRRRGELPRDWKSRQETYLGFMMACVGNAQASQRGPTMHSSFIPPAYLPCTTRLADLRRVMIKDLQLETHHRGTYLLLRSITPPNRMTGIIVIVEDERGDVVPLQLYQQDEENTRKVTDIVNVGTVLLVKEPFLKVMASGEYGLRVDHLTDVIDLDEHDAMIPKAWRTQTTQLSAAAWKAEGNTAVGKEDYWQAIKMYSRALYQQPAADEAIVIKRNRALAFLRTQQYDAALSDLGFSDFSSDTNEKALYRAAQALYPLGRFKECWEVLQQLCSLFPNNAPGKELLERAHCRFFEQETGYYNFALLQVEAEKLKPPQLDHATYIGPIEVRSAGSKGRGLFVTNAVKAGDLLLCEKAFSYAWVNEREEGGPKVTLLLTADTNRGFMGGQADLIRIIAQKLYCNPSVARTFTTLYHGDYKAAETSTVDGKPVVDTFLIERIMSRNVFGCPTTSSLTTHRSLSDKDFKQPTAYGSCGIWTQASYINHSCTSNARRSFIGDMMVVRATQDLEPDTESTFWYQSPDVTDHQELRKKLRNWGFDCECAICSDAKGTRGSTLKERQRLQNELKKLLDASAPRGLQFDKFERLLKALDGTYTRPAHEVPRLLVWDPQLLFTRIYITNNIMGKALQYAGKVLTALGFVVVGADTSATSFKVKKWGLTMDHLVEAFLHARTAFKALGALEKSKQAEDYARVAYKIVVGEDASFDSTYRDYGL